MEFVLIQIVVFPHGVVWDFIDSAVLENCYVCGTLPKNCDVISYNSRDKVDYIKNCYYDKDIFNDMTWEDKNAIGLTTEEMKSSRFVTMLGDKFKMDEEKINNGYPILKFE